MTPAPLYENYGWIYYIRCYYNNYMGTVAGTIFWLYYMGTIAKTFIKIGIIRTINSNCIWTLWNVLYMGSALIYLLLHRHYGSICGATMWHFYAFGHCITDPYNIAMCPTAMHFPQKTMLVDFYATGHRITDSYVAVCIRPKCWKAPIISIIVSLYVSPI